MIKLRPYQQKALKQIISALKENDHPVLLECSVGGGKSYLIGSVARLFEEKNKRVLCLVSSSELVRNNSDAFKELGGNPSVFCSSLNEKSWDKNIVFATPQSLINGIKRSQPIANIIFNMIVVDECHHINYHAKNSTLMRVLRHYKQAYKPMRLLGLSGTPFRGSESICGDHAIFKTKVANISTQYLINHGFLVPPAFGLTGIRGFDFSKCKPQSTGEFKGSDLQKVIDKNRRLTWDILQEVQQVMTQRNVCIVFCSTKAHCYEALAALPKNSARIILGDTSSEDRHEILTAARNKKIKYLISVNCLLTGVNIPALDVIAWLRPTGSLLLYIQGIGRGLRLHEGKKDCLVLDFSGNLGRFQDFDDPIINEALAPKKEDDPEYCIICYQCKTLNKTTARRCRGTKDNKRCSFYFNFKDCPNCEIKNDVTARYCRGCEYELIDPNDKLTRIGDNILLDVIEAKYWVKINGSTGFPTITIKYTTNDKNVFEQYYVSSERSKNFFYGSFVKKHFDNARMFYDELIDGKKVENMICNNDIKTPNQLLCKLDNNNNYQVLKKYFIGCD